MVRDAYFFHLDRCRSVHPRDRELYYITILIINAPVIKVLVDVAGVFRIFLQFRWNPQHWYPLYNIDFLNHENYDNI